MTSNPFVEIAAASDIDVDPLLVPTTMESLLRSECVIFKDAVVDTESGSKAEITFGSEAQDANVFLLQLPTFYAFLDEVRQAKRCLGRSRGEEDVDFAT